MSHSAYKAIGQVRPHQLEIKARRVCRIPKAGTFHKLCDGEIESEEHFHKHIKEKYATLV